MPALTVRRSGLTAVHVLIALVLVILLIALMLPATQSAREAARTAELKSVTVTERGDFTAAPDAVISADAYDGAPAQSGMMGGVAMAPARSAAGEPPAMPATPPPDESGVVRKIIYNAEVSVVVEDFAKAEPQIGRLVEAAGGYIAELNVTGSPGSWRSARWRVRVPVERFEAFIDDIKELGELERNQRTSEDVTDNYYDTEARIKNKQVEEETLVGILKDRGGKLEDVLKVEIELSRVRGEIEQLQGRLRVLTNLSALTTVTINVRERDKFEPAPPAAPDFATLIGRTFRQSVDRLVDLGKAVVLFGVALAPWVPLIIVGVLLLWFLSRRAGRLARRAWSVAQTPLFPSRPADAP
jgi:hypothetical protein